MANKTCSTVASARIQQVFVVLEDVSGVLQRPTAEGYVLPAGSATLNQAPEYTNSDELTGTLDVIDQFRNALGPGEASIPMIVRLPSDGSKMQGHALLASLMGTVQEPNTVLAEVGTGGVTISATTVPVADITGGVITSLTNCVRGYEGTTAAAHDAEDVITLGSRIAVQDNCRPTVSIWLKNDHTVRFASGGVVTAATIPQSKEGGQHCDFTVGFRQMGWCGSSILTSAPAGAVLTVETSEGEKAAEAYTVGGIIKNTTKNADNSGAGYTITAVNYDAGTITVSPAPSGWAADDKIDPWLPEATPIGVALQSADTRVFVGGKAGKLTEGSITIGTPTAFTSEIGDEFPGENADEMRELSMTNGLYFRAKDAVEFKRGYDGYELPVHIVLGNKAGGSLSLVMPRVKFNMPTVEESDSFVTLTRTGAILGTKGNDSLVIVQE